MIVEELIVALGFDVRGEGELRKFDQHIDRAERRAKTFTATLGRLAIAAGGAIAAFGASRALSGFITDITRTNAEFEKYEATLRTITGSAQEAKKSLDWITDFGRRTPYEAGEVTQAFVRLRSYGIDPTTGSLKAVGDAGSAMGKSMMQGVEALADAATGQFERLKEFGVVASTKGDQVTFRWTENGKTIEKTVKKQGDAITAFLIENFRRFDGAMNEQSKTWDGMISNLSDNWTDFLREIGAAGYYEDIKGRLRSVLDTIERWWKDGTIDRLANGISDALRSILRFGDRAFQSMTRFGGALYDAADGVVSLTAKITGLGKEWAALGLGAAAVGSSSFGRAILLMLARRFPMLAAFLAVDDILAGLDGDKSLIGSLEGGQAALDRLKQRFGEAKAAADGLAETINGVFGIDAATGESQIDALMRSVREFLSADYVQFINSVAEGLRQIAAALETVAQWFGALGDTKLTGLSGEINTVAAGLERINSVLNAIPEWGRKFLSGEGWIGMQPGGMLGGFTRWWQERWSTPNDKRSGWGDWFGGEGDIDLPEITVTPDQESLRSQEETTGEVRKNTESTGSRLDAIKEKLGDLLNFFALTGEAAAAINPGAAVYGGGSGGGSGAGRAHPGSPAHGAAGARSMGKDYGGGSYRGDLASGIIAAANELGIDPEDLATAISYETAGTFNPWIKGPTTKWGTHRGLIQWGGPQRKKYGVTKDMSAGEQMQAVARYLRDRGVKPGHGLLEIYSAINAGAVGEQYYGRSDAHAGGAPGTVRDKVNNQMGGHRRKGKALLAAYAAEQAKEAPGPSANDNMAAALKAAGDGVWWLGQNGRTMQGHMDRTSPAGAATRAQNSVNSNSTAYQVAQTINVGGVNVSGGTDKAPDAVGRAVGEAAANGGRKTPVLARRQVNPGAAP